MVKLGDRINTKSSELSTGLRQKMNVVRGFLTDPEVLLLDEPTLGLDVGAARDVREFIRKWMREHPERTLLPAHHLLARADQAGADDDALPHCHARRLEQPAAHRRPLSVDLLTVAITLVATAFFSWCEHKARRQGLLDRSTAY